VARYRATQHGTGIEIPDGQNSLLWSGDTPPLTSDKWTITLRIIPQFDGGGHDHREILTVVWSATNWVRLFWEVSGDRFVAEYAYDDSGLTKKRVYFNALNLTTGEREISIVVTFDGTTITAFTDGTKQDDTEASGSESTTDASVPVVLLGCGFVLDHLALLSKSVSDIEGSNISAGLTPVCDDTKELTHDAALAAGDVLILDYQKRTANIADATGLTDAAADMTGDWGDIGPGECPVVLKTNTAGGLRVRYWKRYL